MDFVAVPPVSFLPFSAGKLRAALDRDLTSNKISFSIIYFKGNRFCFNVTLLDLDSN